MPEKEADQQSKSNQFESNSEVQAVIQEAEVVFQAVFEASFPFLKVEQAFDLELVDGDLNGMVVANDKNFYQAMMEISTKRMGIFRWMKEDELPDPESPPLMYVNHVYPALKAQEVKMQDNSTGYAVTKEGGLFLLNLDTENKILTLYPATEENLKGGKSNESKAGDSSDGGNEAKPKAGSSSGDGVRPKS